MGSDVSLTAQASPDAGPFFYRWQAARFRL